MPRPDGGSASYRAVLALPHARRLFAAALLARLGYGLTGLPLLLALREGTNSYAAAGTATGLYGLAAALLGPARARLVRRRRSALVLLAVGHALSLAALAAACAVGVADLSAVGLAVLAGLCPPPVGPLMRALWSGLTPDGVQRQCALSLDTVAESAVFAVGPVLGGSLAAASSAPAVLAGCGLLLLTGSGLLAAALRRALGAEDATPSRGAGGFVLATRLPRLLALVWAAAAALAACEIGAVAAWGAATAGVLTALFPIGGVLGGLVYGRRRWRSALARRPLAMAAGTAACWALPALVQAPPAAGAALLVAGACTDVLLIAAYQLVDVLVPAGSRTEAGAWLNTAYNLGAAMGAAAGGALADRPGPAAAFAVGAGLVGLCALVCTPGAGRRGAAGTSGAVAVPVAAGDPSRSR